MRLRKIVILSLALICNFMVLAQANIEGVSFTPFSSRWDWEHPSLRGRVVSFLQISHVPKTPSGPLVQNFSSLFEFQYAGDQLKMEQEVEVQTHVPYATITFDEKGRKSEITSWHTDLKSHQTVPLTETAHYDPDGSLTGITIEDSQGPKKDVKIQTENTPDGGKRLVWSFGFPANDDYLFTLNYDKTDRLTDVVEKAKGAVWLIGPKFTYNQQGDVIRSETRAVSSTSASGTIYEYEYDTQQNWIKRSVYNFHAINGTELKELHSILEREITYSKANPADRVHIEVGNIAGLYTAQMGDPAHDQFYSIMTLRLNRDGAAYLTNTMPDTGNPGGKIENKSQGKWQITGNTITITLETGNGHPIPADDPQRIIALIVADDGKHLTSDNGPEFKRQD